MVKISSLFGALGEFLPYSPFIVCVCVCARALKFRSFGRLLLQLITHFLRFVYSSIELNSFIMHMCVTLFSSCFHTYTQSPLEIKLCERTDERARARAMATT